VPDDRLAYSVMESPGVGEPGDAAHDHHRETRSARSTANSQNATGRAAALRVRFPVPIAGEDRTGAELDAFTGEFCHNHTRAIASAARSPCGRRPRLPHLSRLESLHAPATPDRTNAVTPANVECQIPKSRTGWIAALLLFRSAANHRPLRPRSTVTDAWVRGTVCRPEIDRSHTCSLHGPQPMPTLIAIASHQPRKSSRTPHEMKVDGGIMKMGAVARLPPCPPASRSRLDPPGGYHVMLVDLARPLREGDQVPLTLTVAGKDGKTQKIEGQRAGEGADGCAVTTFSWS